MNTEPIFQVAIRDADGNPGLYRVSGPHIHTYEDAMRAVKASIPEACTVFSAVEPAQPNPMSLAA